ncbi:hypothetical protein BD780_000287 [Clostridium tetanomorphum]|uniref:DUF4177 domain-containing protein n=1 Tax=Clostridium tetanomorphum TaxID=1553 RepID=A0A923J1X8_CLOTT|nr:DUF4177 domain-containing protein [Clostridium tetanomorphum]KAJ52916.1 hypothetical protein CTM_04663 [Clostridium tetanomorphum DSM 665]MBC2398170.1 DUF4177 domain-containing protein [Clostridium tetanomorphum]MBP1864856.1 hypothetical protein [Clostridium tetanomorphum]NRS83062.1 hypothetical protein [Clostridium tetanomorphum]NRZ98841.1 hypothetical protein [Clostridium tetanomorphum]
MYEYKFVSTDVEGIFTEESYEKVIEDHAKKDWRLVQILLKDFNSNGRPRIYQVILEREIVD